jgi:hypothetical protein
MTWIGIRAARESLHEMFGSFARKWDTGRKQTVAAQERAVLFAFVGEQIISPRYELNQLFELVR